MRNYFNNATHLIARGPGVNAKSRADAVIAPRSWAIQKKTNLAGPMTPVRNKARVILGLKRPPVILKNSHADISKLSPMEVAM